LTEPPKQDLRAPPPPIARKRLPFEQELRPFSGAKSLLSVYIYLVLALCCAAASYYMGAIRGLPLDTPHVVAPAAGALYFTLRFFLMAWPRIGRGGR